jgi:Cu-Zn family superoxide dismutase
MHKRLVVLGTAAIMGSMLAGCFDKHDTHMAEPVSAAVHDDHVHASSEVKVQSELIDSKGSKIGVVTFTATTDGGVKVNVDAEKVQPGAHGFHFHDTGKCEAPDFKTAGAHLNTTGKKHGWLTPEGPHVGDLPNVTADANGAIHAEFTTKLVTLEKGKPNSLLKNGGTAIVLHDKADDYLTDPSGNSGDKIACGVISG